MDLIANQNNRRIWLTQLQQGQVFQSPCPDEDFAALIAVYDATVTNDNRNVLSNALIQQGLRNGVCWGYDCSLWDDALDYAYLATDPDWNPSGERFVMTSWFANTPLEEAVFYFLKCTGFDRFQPRNFVALILGGEARENIAAAIRQELTET